MTMSVLDRLAEIQQLAVLPAVEYDIVRRETAKRMGIRPSTLDTEVAKEPPHRRAEPLRAQGSPTWEPQKNLWAQAVAGDELFADLIAAIQRYVMLDSSAALTV